MTLHCKNGKGLAFYWAYFVFPRGFLQRRGQTSSLKENSLALPSQPPLGVWLSSEIKTPFLHGQLTSDSLALIFRCS